MWKTIALWMLLLCILSEGNSTSKRVKRILGGRPYAEDKHNTYQVITYYATFADVHNRPYIAEWLFLKPWAIKKGWWGEIKCGGLLLTPEIVQTACHCISTWFHDSKTLGFVGRPRIDHLWEGVRVVYIGATSRFFADFADEKRPFIDIEPIHSLQFIAHPACGYIELDPNPRTYDYGWIKVDPKWTIPRSGVPLKTVHFAPTTNVLHNNLYFRHVLARQKMCLHIGFGWYNEGQPYTSTRLRVGWGQAASQLRCIRATAYNIPKKYLDNLMNWFCVESETWGNTMTGDSGGPVTCDGALVGIVSGHRKDPYWDPSHLRKIKRWWSIHGSVSRNHFAMSIEYRKQFEEFIRDINVVQFIEFGLVVWTPFYYPYPTSPGTGKLFSESQLKRFKAQSSVLRNTSSGGSYPVVGTPSSGPRTTYSAGPSLVVGTGLALVRHFTP